jgi:hypothetical protein
VREDDDESVAESKELGFVLLCFCAFVCFFFFFGFFFSPFCRGIVCVDSSQGFFLVTKEKRKEGKGRTDWRRIILAFCFCFCC